MKNGDDKLEKSRKGKFVDPSKGETAKPSKGEIVTPPKGEIAKADPKELKRSPAGWFPFLNFRFTYRSVYTDGEQAHIKAQETRYENGRLETEAFEGTASLADYFRALAEMQKALMKPVEDFLRPFLPKPDPQKTDPGDPDPGDPDPGDEK